MGVQPAIAGMRRSRWFLKTTAVVVAISFLGLTLQPLAIAAQLPPAKKSSTPTPRPSSDEERLSANLEKIETRLSRMEEKLAKREDASQDISKLKTLHKELGALDKAALDNFDKIKKQLEEKKLPKVILDRHEEAVRTYRRDMETLKANLEDLDKTRDDDEREAKARKAKEHLKEKQKKKPHTPLDPNNLPFRVPDAKKTRKPAEKKEDFQKLGLLQEERIQLASTALLPGMLTTSALAAAPSVADLAETLEVRFSQQINELATSLGNDPTMIYEHVKNNFVFEPYYGSLKGAHETLAQKAGNDLDLASLLIALLRTSGIPARYVVGTVDVPIDKAMSWLGVEKPDIAADIFATGGTPSTIVVSGGAITSLRLEHVWVEAFVPYENYRGHAISGGKQWVPLDPSFKLVKYTPGPDLKSMMQLDADAFTAAITANATIDESAPSVTSVSESVVQQQIQILQQNLANAVATSLPNATPQDLIGNVDILKESFGLLPVSLPYAVVADGGRYSQVPDSVRYRVKFEVRGDLLSGASALSYETTMTELAGKKVTLAYEPATSADAATLNTYGRLSSTPAYLVEMKPTLLVDGVSKASGGGKGLGLNQSLTTTFILPGTLGADRIATDLIVGSYYAIGLPLQKVSSDQLARQADRFTSLETTLSSPTPTTISRDDVLGDALHATAINYFYNLGAAEDLISRISGLVLLRQPSAAVTFVDSRVTYVLGLPTTVRPTGLSIDVDRHVVSPFSRSGDRYFERSFLIHAGLFSSEFEHVIFERMFNVHSTSMKRVFDIANANGIPIFAIYKTNLARLLSMLQVDQAVKDEVQTAVNRGMIVAVPRENVSYNGWQGAGYLVLDPVTFSSAYLIRGGLNGGSTTDNPPSSPPPLVGGCAVSTPWAELLGEIDALLTLANGALGGQVNLSGFAASICSMLSGISPAIPADANKAEQILQRLLVDAAVMVVMSLAPTAAKLIDIASLETETSAQALAELAAFVTVFVIDEIQLQVVEHKAGTIPTTFSGYFILHYLYEYVVLFRAGLLSAFPDDQW